MRIWMAVAILLSIPAVPRAAERPRASGAKPVISQVIDFPQSPGLSPNAIADIVGNDLADGHQTAPVSNPVVLVNNIQAHIDSTDFGYIEFQIPAQTQPGTATVTVVNDGVASDPFQITLTQYSPSLDCTSTSDNPEFCGYHNSDKTSVTVDHPAIPGESIQIYANGLGAVEPPPETTLTINGQPVAADLSEITFVQGSTGHVLFFDVPALPPGVYPIVLSIAGYSSPAGQFPVGSPSSGGVPQITSLVPSSIGVGSGDFTLTVNGSGFSSAVAVFWNGTQLPSTLVDSTTLVATVSSSLVTSVGTATVQVGGAESASNSLTFSILTPAIVSLDPTSASAGQAGFTLTVTGSNFAQSSVVNFNGITLNTSYIGTTQLSANVTSDLLATAQTLNVQVVSLDTASNSVPFVIGGASAGGPMIAQVYNTYQLSAGLAPGVLTAAFGQNLADTNQNGPLNNPEVLVNGISALIDFTSVLSSGSSITFQIPRQVGPGSASVVVVNDGISSAPFNIQVNAYAPTIDTDFSDPKQNTCYCTRADETPVTRSNPAKTGEKLSFGAGGFGAADPPPKPSLAIDGSPVPITLDEGTYAGGIINYSVDFTVPQLSPGLHSMVLSVAGYSSPSLFLPVGSAGGPSLLLSQTGATFRAVSFSVANLERDVAVVSTAGVISWTAAATTFSGGDWLQIDRNSGSSDSSETPPVVRIVASAAKLNAGDYFGQVVITPTDGSAIQIVSIVLSVLSQANSPGAVVEPSGIIFVSPPDGVPDAQSTQITNPSVGTLSFTTSAAFSASDSIWYGFQPAQGNVSPGVPLPVSVQPLASLPTGVYSGAITFRFSDGSVRVVQLLWVVAPGAPSSVSSMKGVFRAQPGPRDNSACTPTELLAVFTLLGENFTAPVAYPASITALVVDDCGNPLVDGSVTLRFSNGDVQLQMDPDSSTAGSWSRTWVPEHPVTADLSVTLHADSATLHGVVTVRGTAPSNPNVPIVEGDGVVASANYGNILAPGAMISIFGKQLASDKLLSGSLPLPDQVSTGGLASGVSIHGVSLPIYYVSPTQINAMVPYDLPKGTNYLVVTRGPASSISVPLVLLDAAPGIFTRDQSGKGDGVISGTDKNHVGYWPSSSQPAVAGDVLTAYCAGLGALQTPLQAGYPAPYNPPTQTANPVTATLGGVKANVEFSGLVPFFVGLYQVNIRVPSGVPAGDHVPLVITVAGQSSLPVTVAVR